MNEQEKDLLSRNKKIKQTTVYLGKAKNYKYDASLETYFYIKVKNKSYTLPFGGWDSELTIKSDGNGKYVFVDNEQYYLKFKG